MTMELMGGEIQPVDEKRERLLANLAKAREARRLKAETRTDPVEPKSRKKKARKAKGKREFNAVVAPKKQPPLSDWVGLSPTTCAIGCEPDCCLITCENVCGHPAKGGLQGKYMQDKQVLQRFGQARQYLAHIEAESKKKF